MGSSNLLVQAGTRVGGGLFSKIFRYKLFSFFIIYIFLSVIFFGISTGDWVGAFTKIGEEFINPLQDLYTKLVDLNIGADSIFSLSLKYILVYFAFYKIWLWFKLTLLFVNFLMKDANSPLIRVIITLILFLPIFYFSSSLYSTLVLKENLLYPFTLTKDIWAEIVKFALNPQSFEFAKDNVCTNVSGCVI